MSVRLHHFITALVLVVGSVVVSDAAAQTLPALVQLPLVQVSGQAGPPLVLTLPDALERAKKNDAQFRSVVTGQQSAREDRVQARASLLPSLSHTTQYLGTQGNTPMPTGRFVSNDGVHLYRSWMVLHQELSPDTLTATPLRRAQAAEVLAQAQTEVAQRGLAVTVTTSYYALVTAERRYASAQIAAQQAQRFLDIAQQQQRLGQVAQSDVVKADIQFQLQQQVYQESMLQMENARLTLAVLLFADLNQNFTVVDDLTTAPALPSFAEARSMAERDNPDLRAANASVQVAQQDVRAARHAFLPSIVVDADYGIEANSFALHSVAVAAPELGVLPNLGYFVTVNLSVPVWDWGGLRSKLQQSRLRETQAGVEVSQATRQLASRLYSLYNEAVAARAAVDGSRRVADLASESLRLTNLRYQAGESSALEVIDAQNTLVQARDSADAALARYRVALADLQTVTGTF